MRQEEKILSIIAPYQYGSDKSRAIAHGIKAGDPVSMDIAGKELASTVPNGTTLIPIPNSSGKAVTTLQLCQAMQKYNRTLKIQDAIVGSSRQRAYDVKKTGKAKDVQDYGYKLRESVSPSKTMLVDNCVDTGVTAIQAAKISGIYTVVTYAVTTKPKICRFRWVKSHAEAAYYSVAYKVLYKTKKGFYSPLCGTEMPLQTWMEAKSKKPTDAVAVDMRHRQLPFFLRRYHIVVGGPKTWCKKGAQIAYRPGFHLYERPACEQFNMISNGKRTHKLAGSLVWAEVLYSTEKDYTPIATARTYHDSKGHCLQGPNYYLAGMNSLPVNGFYKYKEKNSQEANNCVCAGNIYITRVLTNSDVMNILGTERYAKKQRAY